MWEKFKDGAVAMWQKLRDNAAIIGVLVALGGVVVAYVGLVRTATQLQGTTIYNVAKDGKTLQRRYEKGEATADEVMSYFFSVYVLHTARVLDGNRWASVETTICNFINM